MRDGYRDDLAHIHDAGFGQLAMNAAHMSIEELRRAGVSSGLVVDIGCGSGIESRLLCDAGYDVLGIDLSAPLVALARKRVPEAAFRVSSFATADIPPCVAVTAIGEVLNYTFDTANCSAIRSEVFNRIFAALAPNGLLVFDMAGPERCPSESPQRTFTEDPDWAVLAETECDSTHSHLTRRITTFRKIGELYRRDFEVHQLQLVDPGEIVETLEFIGFCVKTLTCYGALALPKGLVGFLARKPANAGA